MGPGIRSPRRCAWGPVVRDPGLAPWAVASRPFGAFRRASHSPTLDRSIAVVVILVGQISSSARSRLRRLSRSPILRRLSVAKTHRTYDYDRETPDGTSGRTGGSPG